MSGLLLLMLASLSSFMDRYLLTLVVQPLKADLGLTDTQIGILAGPAFAIFFSIIALPMGWLIDHRARWRLLSLCIAIWSLAAMGCGLARSFNELLLARALVGIGEAALMPAAFSLLADLFPPAQRGRAFATFTMSVFAGGGLAQALGGGLMTLLSRPLDFPLIGLLLPWRAAFMAVGLTGLPIAAVMLWMTEPQREATPGDLAASKGTSLVIYAAQHKMIFAAIWTIYSLVGLVSFGFVTWAPTLLNRDLGVTVGESGIWIGTATLVGGVSGALISGLLADRWTREKATGRKLRTTLIFWVAAFPVLAGACFARSPAFFAIGALSFMLVNGIAYSSAFAVIQDMVPPALRGRTTAFWYLVTGLIGNGLGPTLPALVSDSILGGPAHLARAIVFIDAPLLVLGLVLTLASLKAYDRVCGASGGMERPGLVLAT